MPSNDSPELCTLAEAADLLRIGQRTLDKLLADGEIKPVRIGTRVLIPIEHLWDYVWRQVRE